MDDIFVAVPYSPSSQSLNGINQFLSGLIELATVSYKCDVDVDGQATPIHEDKLVKTVYQSCYAEHRVSMQDHVLRAISALDTAITSALRAGDVGVGAGTSGSEGGENGGVEGGSSARGPGSDDGYWVTEDEYWPQLRAVKHTDLPRLEKLRHHLDIMLCALRAEDADYLSLYRGGLLVLADVEDEKLAPVLREIDYSLRMNIIHQVCGLPAAVETLIHTARRLSSHDGLLPRWSVTWVFPSPHVPPPPHPPPLSQEDMATTLEAVYPGISCDDCTKIIELSHRCVQICEQENSSKAESSPALHSEAILMQYIVENKIDVYPYLVTSPITLPWSCYACARLLRIVSAERQLRLTMRGCSDTVFLPSILPSIGKDIDAALSKQLLADLPILVRNRLKTIAMEETPWSPPEYEWPGFVAAASAVEHEVQS